MEAEPKPSEQDESRSSELSSVDLSDIESDSEAPAKVEWLATGRQRRATAGNRMKTMLANEEPDSDLELLFAEDDDDQGFSDDAENASDVQMDSSSDDEDETNANDELEGEHELEKQDKARRAAQRKRKAQAAIPAKFRKKVRIDTTATTPSSTAATTPAPRLDNNTNKKNKKKKSERTSWLPSAADLPTRASSRQTTRLSKEQLHAQMEERERKRLKQLAQMEKKAARLEALKKPPMTQEDRLREAAEVEERNSKSLNRWEEAEKLREEERRAKLAALHERTLRGPVITFWSGKGHFGDGFVKTEGINVVVEEKPKRQKKEKASKEPKGKDKKKVQGEGEAGKTDVNGPAPETVAKTESQADAAKSGDASATTQAPATNGDAKVDENKDGNKKTDGESEVADVTMMDAPAVKETDAKESDAKAQDNSPKADAPQNVIAETADAPRPDEKAAETTEPTTEAPTEAPSEETSKKTEAAKPEAPQPAAKEAEQIKTEDAEPASTTPAEKPAEQPTEQQNEPKTDDGAQNRDKIQMPVQAQGAAPKGTLTAPTTDGIDTTQANDTAPQPTATITTNTTNTAPQNQNPLNPTENNPISQTQPETSTPQPTEPKNEKDGKPTTRNAITYQNFNENAIRDKPIQTQILFGRKMNRLPST
jgi:vacuolar protein sorting-associated protein 72